MFNLSKLHYISPKFYWVLRKTTGLDKMLRIINSF